MQYIQNLDDSVIFFINENIFNFPAIQVVFKHISSLGNGGFIWILTAACLLINKKTRTFGIFMGLALLAGNIIGNGILKPFFARNRPFIEHEFINLYIKEPSNYSFPSGHSLSSFVGGVSLFLYNKKYGIYFLMLAFLIAVSRVILMVHYPTDVLVGAVLGSLIAVCFFKLYLKYSD